MPVLMPIKICTERKRVQKNLVDCQWTRTWMELDLPSSSLSLAEFLQAQPFQQTFRTTFWSGHLWVLLEDSGAKGEKKFTEVIFKTTIN